MTEDRTNQASDHAAASDTSAAKSAEHAAAPVTDTLPAVLSAREAATALGVSERTVRRAITRGELTAVKHAGSFHITPAAVEAYRQREKSERRGTGHSVLSQTATPDTSAAAAQDNIAAAPDRTPVARPDRAAAADESTAIAILREMLAEERAESDRLREASTYWQTIARQYETQLKMLEAGPITQDAGDAAAADIPDTPTTITPTQEVPRLSAETPGGALRRIWRRITSGQ